MKRSDLALTRDYLKCVDIETSVRIAKAIAVYTVLESNNHLQLEELEREARLKKVFSFTDIHQTIIDNL